MMKLVRGETLSRNMRPSVLTPGTKQEEIDKIVKESFAEDYAAFAEARPEDYFLDRIGSAIYYRMPWILSAGRNFSGLNALELGCGRGLKAIPWSRLFRSYTGVDLDKEVISFARNVAAKAGRANLNFLTGNASDVIKNPTNFGITGKIDVIIVYASLEHMTIGERREVLGNCREILQDGGALIVSETPNRLIPFDSHSTYLHFFQSLPPELALEYIKRSPRSGAAEYVQSSEEALYRYGQGLSYHEFELWLASGEKLPAIVADGWSPWTLSDDPPRRSEIWLNDYLEANGSLAPSAFGRYWIDAIFDGLAAPGSTPASPRFTPPKELLYTDKQHWTLDIGVYDFHNALRVEPDGECSVLINLKESRGAIAVDLNDEQVCTLMIDELRSATFPKWHDGCAVDLSGFGHVDRLCLSPADGASRLVSSGIVASKTRETRAGAALE